MQIASGKIVDGRVVVEAELPEGADVTLIALDGEETFEVSPELEAIILRSIDQGRHGDVVAAEDLIAELRSRE